MFSTHTDEDGNVLAVYNDGDLGVYKHEANADGKQPTKHQIDKRHKNSTSAGGEKMGETKYWDEFENPDSHKPEGRINFGESFGNEPLYLKSKTWGMTYDSKVIVLSTNEEEEFTADSTKEYIYKGASFLFYKLSNDSLIIYTADKAHTPQVFNSKINIKQIELDNPAMMKLKGDSAFKSQGLNEFK